MSTIVELRQSEADLHTDVHEWLKAKLGLPEWYGSNLDALWDCITGYLQTPLRIRWFADTGNETRYSAIVEIFRDAAEEYEGIEFEYTR